MPAWNSELSDDGELPRPGWTYTRAAIDVLAERADIATLRQQLAQAHEAIAALDRRLTAIERTRAAERDNAHG